MIFVLDNDRVRSHPPEVIAEAWRLQRSGIDATNAGRPAEGAKQLWAGLSVLGWREDAPFDGDGDAHQVVARLLNSLAYAEAELGRTERGLSLLDSALPLAAPEHRGLLINQRGLVLWRAGRNLEALECFNESEPLLGGHGFVLASMLLNRGSMQCELGRYKCAREDLRRCAALAEKHEWADLQAKALHSLGVVEEGVRDIPAALALFAQAERVYAEAAPDMLPQLAFTTSYTLRSAGLQVEAATKLDAAIAELREQGRALTLLDCEVQRARIALDMGYAQQALSLTASAAARAREQNNESLLDWIDLARREAEFAAGPVSKRFAEETLELAARRRQLGIEDDVESAELLAARVLIANGDLRQAERLLAYRGARSHGQRLRAALGRQLGRAELAVKRGDTTEALRHLRAGLRTLHRHRQTFGSIELQAGVAALGTELATMGVGIARDSGRPSSFFAWAERSRAQAFRLPAVTPPDDPDTADLVARTRAVHDTIREAEQAGDPATEERTVAKALTRRLRERSWQLAGPAGASVPELRPHQVHAALAAKDAGMVSFVHHRGQLHALILGGGRTRQYDLGNLSDVAEPVRRLLADLDALTGRRLPARMVTAVQSSLAHQAGRLDEILFGQFRRLLGDRDLVLVPTQQLSALPWSILPSLKGRPVTVAPSASVWCAALDRPAPRTTAPLLACGPGLTHAEEELRAIAVSHADPVVLQGHAASPADVLSNLDGSAMAHLAAHGYHEPENVLFSRLDFAGGPLMAYDIARLEHPPAHVTLSACDVGRSNVVAGEETLGFTAALLYAGTRTVVSSMAKVEHETAADIMTNYHRGIVAGLPPARALADASQRRPYCPFVCYGAG